MASRDSIDAFLAAPRIAVVGVSRDPKSFSRSVYDHLRAGDREVVPVNPAVESIDGRPCHASVTDVDGDLDGVLVMVPADAAVEVVDQCVARGVERVWLHRGAGPGAVSDEAVDRCRAAGVDVVDGACPMMFAEPVGVVHRVHRFFTRRRLAA